MALECWSEPLSGSDPTRYKKGFYKRQVFIRMGDVASSTSAAEFGARRVDYSIATNPQNTVLGMYNFGQAALFRTGAGADAQNGMGYAAGVPASDFWNRGTHFHFSPIVFASAFVLPSQDALAGSNLLIQLGDTQYTPKNLTTQAGIVSPGGNAFGIGYRSSDLKFYAFNRGPTAGNLVTTTLNLVASLDKVYIVVANYDGSNITTGIYDENSDLISDLVTQNLASDFVTALPVSAPITFSGTNTLSYPKFDIQTDGGTKTLGLFWYFFEDTTCCIPESLLIGA